MTRDKIKEILGKQLQLLSENSSKSCEDRELAALSAEMVKIAELLLTNF